MESGSLFILCIPQSMDLCELVVADERLGSDTPTGEGSADFSGDCESDFESEVR